MADSYNSDEKIKGMDIKISPPLDRVHISRIGTVEVDLRLYYVRSAPRCGPVIANGYFTALKPTSPRTRRLYYVSD